MEQKIIFQTEISIFSFSKIWTILPYILLDGKLHQYPEMKSRRTEKVKVSKKEKSRQSLVVHAATKNFKRAVKCWVIG